VSRDAVEIPAYKCDRRLGPQYDSGGFGIVSTVEDFAILGDTLASGGISKNGERILSEFALDVMTKNILDPSQLAAFSTGVNSGYGFGYGFSVNVSPESVGNLAPQGEFFCDGGKTVFMSCDRESGVSVFHAQNLSDFNRIAIPRIRNLVYSCIAKKG
jgi:CubicO group peptidase (beta-lactamase class C family)